MSFGRKKKPTGMTGGKKVKKPPTITKLKKKLDAVFSLYIRAKYPKRCYTCGYQGNLQCGHFVSRNYLATRFEEDNCRPQCAMCNIWGRGKPLDFEDNLILELGKDTVESLKKKRLEITILTPAWYAERIEHYTEQLDAITREKSEKRV